MSSATAHMRAMLDGLMGTARDGSDSQKHHLDFGDSRVCRAFLLDCCPHDIFASTKLELGECSKVHDPALRADYLNATNKEELMYEVSALERLQAFVSDADRRTDHLKRKLAETQQELSAEETSKLNRVHDLTELYGKKLAQIDKAEQDGDSELKEKLIHEAEKIKRDRNQADIEYKNVSKPASSHQHQNLRVCDICSAYLGINDNDARLSDHYGGKLHLGFITVREKLDDLKKLVADMRGKQKNRLDSSKDRSTSNHRDNRHSERERDRSRSDRDYDRRPMRERDIDYDRNMKARGRDYEYSRDRSHSRGRDYDRYRDYDRGVSRSYRDYPREEHRSSRDRDRERERSRSNGRSYRDIDRRDSSRSHDRVRHDRHDSGHRSDKYSDRHVDSVHHGISRGGIFDRSETRNHERELSYRRRIREWEKRESDKERDHIRRKNEELERKALEEQETTKLKEFLEDYKDERDDARFYKGSALARRLADRRKEIEQDELAYAKEKAELELLRKTCEVDNSSPHMIECPDDQPVSPEPSDEIINQSTKVIVAMNGQSSNGNHNPTDGSSSSSVNNSSKPAYPFTKQQPQPTKITPEDKRRQVEELIGKIPTDKDQLFARKLDWSLLDDNLMEKRIRPWVTKKIAEYIGEHEVEVIDFVCKLVSDHTDGYYMIKEIALFFCDEAEKFVVHMWRLLVFELEAKKIGLRR